MVGPALFPLHHGGEGAVEGQNWVQRFNDSDAGVILANSLHSLGALLFTAGLALYVYQARLAHRARGAKEPPSLKLLDYAHVLTISGIGMNGLGGLMRLYESDHPGLERLGDSLWVQVLLVKHLFLIAGVGLAVLLTLWTWRLARREEPHRGLDRASPRIVAMALASFLTILVATLLGAVAANVDLRADLGLPPLTEGSDNGNVGMSPPVPPGTDRLSVPGIAQLGTPARPETTEFTFGVGEGRLRLTATLTWTTDVASFNLTLRDPTGVQPPAAYSRGSKSLTATVTGSDVRAGNWSILVRADQAVNERYVLTAHASGEGPTFQDLERTVTVLGGENFFEANLNMVGPKTLNFTWSVVGSDAKLFFDIHVHHPATRTVEEPIAGEWNRLNGTYRHTFTDTDGASLLWQNNATTPLDVHYRVWGHFTVDSYFPPTRR